MVLFFKLRKLLVNRDGTWLYSSVCIGQQRCLLDLRNLALFGCYLAPYGQVGLHLNHLRITCDQTDPFLECPQGYC
jgi:hypothetical protein